jgi:hypothetical protein
LCRWIDFEDSTVPDGQDDENFDLGTALKEHFHSGKVVDPLFDMHKATVRRQSMIMDHPVKTSNALGGLFSPNSEPSNVKHSFARQSGVPAVCSTMLDIAVQLSLGQADIVGRMVVTKLMTTLSSLAKLQQIVWGTDSDQISPRSPPPGSISPFRKRMETPRARSQTLSADEQRAESQRERDELEIWVRKVRNSEFSELVVRQGDLVPHFSRSRLTADFKELWQVAVAMLRPLLILAFQNPKIIVDSLSDIFHLLIMLLAQGACRKSLVVSYHSRVFAFRACYSQTRNSLYVV